MKRRRRPGRRRRKDEEVRVNMRVVELLDGISGNRGTSQGEPIFMSTVSHLGNIETISFNLRDTKRLVIHALVALASFEVPLAQQILQEHFGGEDEVSFDCMDSDDS